MNEFDELRKLFREEEPVRPEAEPRAAAIAAAMERFERISRPAQEAGDGVVAALPRRHRNVPR